MGTSHSPDGRRTGSPPTTGSDLASVVGYPAVAQRLRSIVTLPVASAWAATPDVVAPAGVLLYGPPGPVATELRDALARELGVAHVRLDLRSTHEWPPVTRCLVSLEGLDDLHLVTVNPGAVIGRMFDLAAELDPVDRPLVIGESVAPWHLDAALLGAGRFDRLVFVPPPGWEARTATLRTGAAQRGLDLDQRVTLLAAATVGWSGADLSELLDLLDAERPTEDAPTDADAEIRRSSQVLDVVSTIVPRTRSWVGRAGEMAVQWSGDGMMDDLVAWLRRAAD